ncbi:DUF6503 family protein [Aureitalea marina]|uniref:Aspartyl-tRNA synthetase n=1 Tax=Aureitalea marina TaxID=930804 RepID=A0A2S7KRP1_9FLAO|nr:DUF6503 family protein [Aureitalea marina]PQB05223.1 hypothetical protein BST85_10265 [Aureitalea marina]
MTIRTLLCLLLIPFTGEIMAQELTGKQLLQNAIEYHDPEGQWSTFRGKLKIVMETPKSEDRISEIWIDLPSDIFRLTARKGELTTHYELINGACNLRLNGELEFDLDEAEKAGLTCERATLYRNYYTYLYGLPMKLKDPGTNVDPVVKRMTFKGKEYLVLNVNYDQEVGTDVWRFYFDPTTYAMEVYQFFKGDPEGKGKNTGEYILLDGIEMVEGMKIPKTRAWYYNKGDKYLGTDILQ